MVLSQVAIVDAISCERVPKCFHPDWEFIYADTSVLDKKLYGEYYSKDMVCINVEYKKLCSMPKSGQQICNKVLYPKHG